MFTFNEFILEKNNNPELLANRVARRFGKKEKYGKWLTAEKGKHIPLKKYNAKIADSVFNRESKVAKIIGGKDLYGSNREKHLDALKKYHSAKISITHKIDDLLPTQPFVRIDDSEKLKQKISNNNPDNIVTATHKGKSYILDGHHSVMAAKLRGETHVKTKHINLDNY